MRTWALLVGVAASLSCAAAVAASAESESVRLDLEKWWCAEHKELQAQIETARTRQQQGGKGPSARLEAETVRREALVLADDRDPADIVARRTAALLADLEANLPAGALAKPREQLAALRAELTRSRSGSPPFCVGDRVYVRSRAYLYCFGPKR